MSLWKIVTVSLIFNKFVGKTSFRYLNDDAMLVHKPPKKIRDGSLRFCKRPLSQQYYIIWLPGQLIPQTPLTQTKSTSETIRTIHLH